MQALGHFLANIFRKLFTASQSYGSFQYVQRTIHVTLKLYRISVSIDQLVEGGESLSDPSMILVLDVDSSSDVSCF